MGIKLKNKVELSLGGQILNVLALLVVSFFTTIYVSSPTAIMIYNTLMFDTLKVQINKSFVIGIFLISTMFTVGFVKEKDENSDPVVLPWTKMVGLWILCGILWIVAPIYKAYLG